MPSYDTLRGKKLELIRKATDGSVFVGPLTVPLLTTLTTTATRELATLPVGMKDAGWVTEDGVAFGRETATSDINSWGSTSPTRSDITTDETTITFTAQETNITTLGLATGFDMSTVTPTATTGEVDMKMGLVPSKKAYRVLALAVDKAPEGEIYIGRYFPRAEVNSFTDQTFSGGDSAVEWGVTMTAKADSTAGYAARYLFGGPGWHALLVAMGFPAAAA